MVRHKFSVFMQKCGIIISLSWLFFVLVFFYGCSGGTDKENDKPNIIIIVADDMGFSDIGCYGSEIKTPNIDALANNGVRFTQFYNSARCSPSRASILTGLYPHQAGVGYLTSSWAEHHRQELGEPGYTDHLSENSVTIAEALKQAGYSTYLSGKWHVGQKKPYWPCYRGFDSSLVLLEGYHYFDPSQVEFAKNDGIYKPNPEGFYSTDFFTSHTVDYIDKHSGNNPFFLYLAYTAPHSPIHAPEDEIQKYLGSYMAGWDSLRSARFERMKNLGIISKELPLSHRHNKIPAWDSLNDKEKAEWDRRMAVYAAQISIMDDGIGRVTQKLKEKKKFNNTLIMFLSDNGGASAHRDRGDPEAEIGSPASWQSYGAWANVSNTPFRLYKRFTHEGGIATPLIVHWPDGIERKADDLVKKKCHLIDILPTCLDVAGATYPGQHNGNKITPTPGKSLRAFLKGENPDIHDDIFWEHEGNRGIIAGNWKLVASCGQPWELYNLDSDRTELDNLSEKFPEKMEELSQKWENWANEAGVVPWQNSGGCFNLYDYTKGYNEE